MQSMLTPDLCGVMDPEYPALLTSGMRMTSSASRAMIGEKSSPMPPTRAPGITRRIGPNTGSVMLYTNLYTDAIGESGEIGNQLKITRTKMTMRYACRSQEMGCDDTGAGDSTSGRGPALGDGASPRQRPRHWWASAGRPDRQPAPSGPPGHRRGRWRSRSTGGPSRGRPPAG